MDFSFSYRKLGMADNKNLSEKKGRGKTLPNSRRDALLPIQAIFW
jgi:hypothetical protein